MLQLFFSRVGESPAAAVLLMTSARTDRERVDLVVDKLPTRRFQTEKELRLARPGLLKEQLRSLGVSCIGMAEKEELVRALLARRGDCCAVCSEDLQPGEAYRRTLCGHAFHEKCLREAAIHENARSGKMPQCPMCRQALNEQPLTVKNAEHEATREPMAEGTRDAKRQRTEVMGVPLPSADGCAQQ